MTRIYRKGIWWGCNRRRQTTLCVECERRADLLATFLRYIRSKAN